MAVIDPSAKKSPMGGLPRDLHLKKPQDADKWLTMDNVKAIARAMGYGPQDIAKIEAKAKGKPSLFIENMGAGNDMKRISTLAQETYEEPHDVKETMWLLDGYSLADKKRWTNLLNDRKSNPIVWNYMMGLLRRNRSLDTVRDIIGKSRNDDDIVNIVAASQEAGIEPEFVDEVLGSLDLGTTTQEVATIRAHGKYNPTDAMAKFRQGERDSINQQPLGVMDDRGRTPLPGDKLGTGGGLGTGQPGITDTSPGDATPFGEPVPTDPAKVDDYIRRNFGYWSFLLDDPELGETFRKLARDKAPAGAIQAAVINSTWYKTHTAAQQTWAALASTNPAQANAQLQSRAKDISDITRRYGMTLDPTRMSKLAEDSLKFGWNDQQLMAAISNEGVFAAGKSNPIKANLQKTASDYVLNFSNEALDTWTKQIIAGEATEEEFKLYAQEQALSMYPSLAAAITSGRTVKQYADQYVQKAAQVLELPEDKINLQESKWQKALQHRNPKTGEIQSMTLAEWEDYLKTDPSYNYNKTKGARQEARKLATTIASTFGAV